MLHHKFMVSKAGKECLAITLIVLREKFKGQPIDINISREDIASMAGNARKNVARLLREFKDGKLI